MYKRLFLILSLLCLMVTILVGCHDQGSLTAKTLPPPDSPGLSPAPSQTLAYEGTPLTMLSLTEGDVLIKKLGVGDWAKGRAGMSLESGDIIKADGDSSVVITFFDGSTIELLPGAQIEVVTLDLVKDTGSVTIRLKQQIGETVSRVQKLADSASRYEIETPAGVAAVRGTIMVVNVVADGTTTITNQEGSVWAIAGSIRLLVPVGRQAIIIPGWPPRLIALFKPRPAIAMTKTAEPGEAQSGDVITYTYQVTNTGNVPLSEISVVDDKSEPVSLQSGDTDGDGELDLDETWMFICMYTVTEDDESPLVNSATVTGTDALSNVVMAQATASVTIKQPVINDNGGG